MRLYSLLFAGLALVGVGALAGRVSAGDAAPPGQPPGLSLCTSLCRRDSAYAGPFVEHGVCYRDGKAQRTVDSSEVSSPNESHEQLLRACPKL
jgi:hypothetical protein